MFITAVCMIFLITPRWSKTKSLNNTCFSFDSIQAHKLEPMQENGSHTNPVTEVRYTLSLSSHLQSKLHHDSLLCSKFTFKNIWL